MKADVILGLQWGDEGKGKIVDYLTPDYDMAARFQGGPNAGHTLSLNGKKYILKSIPSGIFQEGVVNIIGSGVVIDPARFKAEAEGLEKAGLQFDDRLFISKRAHLILPTHKLLDSMQEKVAGEKKIGTTGRGIGPTYTDKIARRGLRVGDLLQDDFGAKYREAVSRHEEVLRCYDLKYDLPALEEEWFAGVEKMKQFRFIDSEYFINFQLQSGQRLLAEGAQGSMLDIDFGCYPYVTSSNTICAGACTGLGISPQLIGDIYGVFKAYCTRVGSGPFPTELFDSTADLIRERGCEFGSVTGRPRRCGWLDLVALQYTIMLNGVNKLIMMKSDVLDTFDTIKVCEAYKVNGEETAMLPFDMSNGIEPVYVELPGWKTDTSKMTSEDEFPEELNGFISFLEEKLNVPICIVSLGPDRKQTVVRGE